ncbi:hypothetical protein [Bartonella vinsonii]|nr:hypothetical protein [Bartonella vinsonii]
MWLDITLAFFEDMRLRVHEHVLVYECMSKAGFQYKLQNLKRLYSKI